MTMKVFVLTGHSESGDDYGPLVFSLKPKKKQLREIAHDWDGDENEDGPGNFGSYVYLSLYAVKVDSNRPEEIDFEE